MAEALRVILKWALAQPRIVRAGAICDRENAAWARGMKKAGMMREGLLRRWLVHPNISNKLGDCLSCACVR
jgi:RimJ/RimL family protein N-acetyltransferase